MDIKLSTRTASFTESVIREMARLAMEHHAINLALGFPDFTAPQELKEAAREAIANDLNQYPITWGEEELREALANKYERTYGMHVDPEREVCVTCGSTVATISSTFGLLNYRDEVVIFEPYYENYGPDTASAAQSRGT